MVLRSQCLQIFEMKVEIESVGVIIGIISVPSQLIFL